MSCRHGLPSVRRGAEAARQLIEFGMPLLRLVVPSTGSRAISKRGEPSRHVPMRSPLNRPGASSLMPSPMTTSPQMSIEVEHAADRVAGGLVGFFLLALAQPLQGVERGQLGGAQEVHFDLPFDVHLGCIHGR